MVETTLDARETWVDLAGRPAHLYTYNGQMPGPVITARAGDTIRISFTNTLAEMTNLHFHGLHISPEGIADNSFLEVSPGELMTYELPIPSNHPNGMFWYHPHMHGSVAQQVSQGLAGVILIRGEFDEQPDVHATPEYLMVLQDFDIAVDGQIVEPSTMDRTQGREGPLVTVNGEQNPAIPLRTGGWTRLRLLNASVSRFYRLRLEGHRFTIVATDGGPLPAPVEVEELLIVPGQRFDVFVRGQTTAGSFRLLNLPYSRFGNMGGARAAGSDVLATFECQASMEASWTMPATLGNFDTLPAPRMRRTFRFGMGMGMGMGMSQGGFTINGRSFDPNRVDTRVRLGDVEDWDLVNSSAMDHPFHIHTNAFQVVRANGQAERAWRDVVLVPAFQTVRIRLRFEDYTGKAMYHCHILDHEDLGMMGIIEVAS
jgi:FtsP/CotA-like multicopper oxidase with cupredoxin domain